MLSRRTKEESFDPLENCSFSSSVVAREARLVDWCCFATLFFARSARRLCTHVNHGIKQPTCRCIEVKCLCVHMLAGSLDTNSEDCVGGEDVPLRADVMLCVFRTCSRRTCVRHRDMRVTRGSTTLSTSITHGASRCAGMCVGRAP